MNKSDTGGDAVDSNLDDSENQWRHSMHRRKRPTHSRRSPQANSVRLSGIDPYGSQPEYHSHSYDHGQNSALRDHSYNSYEFQYEDEGVGNTTFYDFEGDSIISSDGDPDSSDVDADPTIHANATASHYRSPNSHSYLHSHSHLHSSLSASSPHTSALNIQTTAMTKAAARDEEDDGTSFEGTGTPGSPASLLWMDPAVERHLGD
ncbi:hypothetical protein BT96DRAFT_947160 [Gymnopus androsaceus JB14]|uniref:Uncharacterized protein n=1 Tax=Gymnopus androsaceus JB14 TaxID=1447944 RepID=A0A6A4GTB3_9AGAR|nr:hypothetical protein BT96DRAFT_947160 [Gymnopus androsaceus JB14]